MGLITLLGLFSLLGPFGFDNSVGFVFSFGFDNPVVLQGTTNFDLKRPPWSICSGQLGLWVSFPFVQVLFWLYALCLLQEVFITLESVILVCRWECRSGVSAPPMTHQVPKGLLVG